MMPGAMKVKEFFVVVAAAMGSRGIGRGGGLPWPGRLKGDMAHFKKLTVGVGEEEASKGMQNAVIMGRKTWQSIPPKFRPLPGRFNVVLSRNPSARDELGLPSEVLLASSLSDAMEQLHSKELAATIARVFVIGGGSVYKEALLSDQCAGVIQTMVGAKAGEFDDCDTFFPDLGPEYRTYHAPTCFERDGDLIYWIDWYFRARKGGLSSKGSVRDLGALYGNLKGLVERNDDVRDVKRQKLASGESEVENEEEMQYLRLLQDIIENGADKGDRTGTGTLSKFGVQMRFSLRDGRFPLLTTKRVFWRGVAEELLWLVSGCTNANALRDKKVHIWDANATREFLDGRGLKEREQGDLGPVYGFQWRHFGAKYTNMHADYSGQGVDQLMDCIYKIKNSPEDRRIILSAWNPADLDQMALPPCHMFCQFYVANGELSCQMYQRSADMGLGVPFNIASYSLLTRMIAQVCGLEAGDFVHVIGDAHVYKNHVEALKEQIGRVPRAFPKLRLNSAKMAIDDFVFEDFSVEGYSPDKPIKMDMAV